MARMIPEEIEDLDRATRGEKDLFRFLRETARPHEVFTCWYKPSIGCSWGDPDFLLYGKDLGLLVMEVRDWALEQITAVTPHRFNIRIAEKDLKVDNPDRLGKARANSIADRLKEISGFNDDRNAEGKPIEVPIGRMVVFPNIQRQAYCQKGLQWLIPLERAIFRDDLDPAGELLGDSSGKIFRERISECLPFRLKRFDQKVFDVLTDILGPFTKIELPSRSGEGKDQFQQDVRSFDEDQATLAMQLGRGHQIIKGPPGSGKTLVLIHRCGYLYKYHPRARRILFVCYNIALVSYIKQLLGEKGIHAEGPDIQVLHFFELCSRILKEPVHFENEDFEYYNQVIEKTLNTVTEGRNAVEPFDAIFIDEAQDFNGEMLSIVMALHKSGGDLVIALDSFQDLYKRKRSWKSLGVRASGRTRTLKQVYRNTEEIKRFSQRFIGEKTDQDRQLTILPRTLVLHGDVPVLCRFPNHDAIETFLANDIKERVKKGDYKRSEIAIIYDDKVYGSKGFTYDNRALPMGMLKKLESAGIPTKWVSQDVRTKEMFDVTTDKVSLISIHSSKGLDFDLVYLTGVDHINLSESIRKDLITLVYVAMTRAKHRLVIPYVRESALIRRMKECLTKP
jgi:hypothetical protein